MEVHIEEIGPCRNRLRITLPREKVTEAFEKQFRDLKSTIRIKGFRPGKVPRSFLERRFGSEVSEQVKLQLVEESLDEAIKEHRLDPLGRPEIDLAKILLEPDQDLVFEVVLEVRPSFELGTYTGIEVERPAVEVTEEEIEEELLRMRRRSATLEPLETETVGEEDVLFGTVSVIAGDRKVVVDRGVSIGAGTTTLVGIRVENLRARAVEAGIGETLTFDVTLPSYFPEASLRGQPGKMILALQEAKRIVLPEADDAFAQGTDFDDLAELKAKIREVIEAAKQADADRAVEERILEKISEDTPFSLPEGLVTGETDRILTRLRMELEFEGKSPEEIEEALAERVERQKAEVEGILRRGFLLDAIARKEKIFVTEEELDRHFEALAARDGRDPQEIRSHYEERDMISEVRYHLREVKTRGFLREKAKVA